MDPNSMQTLCKLGVLVCSILGAVCAFGLSHFTAISAKEKEARRHAQDEATTSKLISTINREEQDRLLEAGVGLNVSADPAGKLAMYVTTDSSIDKIGDVEIHIETDNEGRVSLYNSRGFIYFKDYLYNPIIFIEDVERRIKDFEEIFGNEVNGQLILQWRDGEHRLHKKSWPYSEYRHQLDEFVKTGFVKDPDSPNILMSDIKLK